MKYLFFKNAIEELNKSYAWIDLCVSYFKSGTLEFSDGSKVPFKLKRNAKAQAIKFKARTTSSVKITDLVMAKKKWSGLSEVQLYGK